MLGLDKDKVVIVPYSSEWVTEFEQEKKRLETLLKGSQLL